VANRFIRTAGGASGTLRTSGQKIAIRHGERRKFAISKC
jgi:hypothetical protein